MDVKHRLGRLVVLAIHRGAGGVFKGWHMSISVGISIWQEAQWTGQMTAPRTMIFQRWRPGHCFKGMCCASTFSVPRISESHESVHWWIGSACLLVTALTAQHTIPFFATMMGCYMVVRVDAPLFEAVPAGEWHHCGCEWSYTGPGWCNFKHLSWNECMVRWSTNAVGATRSRHGGMSKRKHLTFNLSNRFCILGIDWTQSSFVSYRCRWYSMFCDKKNYQPGDLRGHADTVCLCKTGRIHGWNSLPSLITPVIRRTPAWLKLANRQWCFISPSRGESTTGSRAVCATGSMARMMSWILQLKPRNGGIDFLSRTSFA